MRKLLQWLPFKGGWEVRTTSRTVTLAGMVGVIAGIGAFVFHLLCQFVVWVALSMAVGYNQGGAKNEEELFGVWGGDIWVWMLLIITPLGGLLSGWLVYKFAPEAEGHGTDAAIDAFHNKRGLIRPRVSFVKMFSSAVTIGTGGSGGREGPIAQIGAGFGSYLATRFKLSDNERRILMAAGLGAGIGAIFQAPLAGAIFAAEVLYLDPDFESEALIPSFISTTIAYCVFNVLLSITLGQEAFVQIFQVEGGIRFRDPLLLIPLTGLVAVMVLASLVYVKTFYGIQGMFGKLRVKRWLKPAIGALATVVIGLVIYSLIGALGENEKAQIDGLSVLSFGYGYLQKILTSSDGAGLLVTVLLFVGFGKILTTALTISSGGSGGVFGPSMVIGGCFGAVVGLVFAQIMPNVVTRVDVFVILGMAGFFAAAAKTPISTLIMVSEMTGSYELLLPSMWVCALAYLGSRRWTIFHEQVGSRLDSPAHRGDFIFDVLQGMTIRDALDVRLRKFVSVPLDMPLDQVVRLAAETHQTSFPVVDGDGKYWGLFNFDDVRQFLYDSDVGAFAVAHDLAVAGEDALASDMDLAAAIEHFASGRYEELPVVDNGEVIGLLRRRDVIAAYNSRLMELRTDGE